ncbi:hypothetical protein [Hymenobacter negativus]|uniref:DUF4178 domain-containing protein n=1 Tax=Hymenobacter negativus TaxID=2795026 RepID=A0ABS3QJR4_9BACT|nr:hypothetical protein [Hymenobacter negativus]MBO2011004.1 hypothetical protein [Hymenobacter negativus]
MVNVAILFRVLLFYFLPGVYALRFLFLFVTAQSTPKKRKAALGFVGMIALLAFFIFSSYRVDKNWERNELGTYQLTAYPNCRPCELELRENNVFVVRQQDSIRETGHWRFESGQDYWITYLNEYDQLGRGKYSYTKYHLTHPRR